MRNCGAFVCYGRHVQWVEDGCVINYNTNFIDIVKL